MLMAVLCGVVIYSALHFDVFAQIVQTQITPPPTVPERPAANGKESGDSLNMRFKVRETIPSDYESLEGGEYALDLKTPANIKTEAEYDAATGCYVVRTKLGDREITTPFMLSADEYNNMEMRRSMQQYYYEKNTETAEEKKKELRKIQRLWSG